jgi:hypothetical protein
MDFTFYFVCWLNQEGMDRHVITVNIVGKLVGKTATFENKKGKVDNIEINFVLRILV